MALTKITKIGSNGLDDDVSAGGGGLIVLIYWLLFVHHGGFTLYYGSLKFGNFSHRCYNDIDLV